MFSNIFKSEKQLQLTEFKKKSIFKTSENWINQRKPLSTLPFKMIQVKKAKLTLIPRNMKK